MTGEITNLLGNDERLFAEPHPTADETSFQLDNTSKRYYDSPYYLIAEMHYESPETLASSMESPEAKAAGDDQANFAGAGVTLVTVETETVS